MGSVRDYVPEYSGPDRERREKFKCASLFSLIRDVIKGAGSKCVVGNCWRELCQCMKFVLISSYKMNKSQGCDIQHGDYS